MTGFLPNNGWKGVPYALPPQRNSKPFHRRLDAATAMLPPAQCRDNRAKLDNLRRLIGAEREYREMSAELDRLNDQGPAVAGGDLIHKTSRLAGSGGGAGAGQRAENRRRGARWPTARRPSAMSMAARGG